MRVFMSVSVHVCVCKCLGVCVCVCAYACMCVCVYVSKCAYTDIGVCEGVCVLNYNTCQIEYSTSVMTTPHISMTTTSHISK